MPDNHCGGVRFNKIAGMDSRRAFLLKRNLLQGCFPVETSEF